MSYSLDSLECGSNDSGHAMVHIQAFIDAICIHFFLVCLKKILLARLNTCGYL